MKRIAIALALLVGCASPRVRTPEPLIGFGYSAPIEYLTWIGEAQNCVQQIALLDSVRAEESGAPRAFTVDHLIHKASELRFYAIPTERADGTFTCPQGFQCWGVAIAEASGPAIYLSAQRAMDRVTVKHEVMHVIVESAGEDSVPYHGVPWGLCEYN